MKVVGNRVILTKNEIQVTLEEHKRFVAYFEKHSEEMKNPYHAMLVIMRYLESEGWDFSKIGKASMPKRLRNLPQHPFFFVDDKGNIIYL